MSAVAGHFGEWLQGRLGPDGPIALISMACPALCVRASAGTVEAVFPEEVLARFCADLGIAGPWPRLSYDMPLGGGAGASTATLVAGARALGFDGAPEALARACLAAEGACDPLMFDQPDGVLWASREGRALEHVASPPRCEVVGGFWGAPEWTDPADTAFADVETLVGDWKTAVARGDLPTVARLATVSAEACSALRGGMGPMRELARDLGALGVVRAHTGSARGLIFAPGDVPEAADMALREAGLSGVLRFATGGGA